MPETIQSLIVLAIGFAAGGLLATGYQAATDRPASFRLIGRGPSLEAFAAVPFLVFAAPFIIMRSTLARREAACRRFEIVMLATIAAGFWSLMSGTVLVMALRAAGILSS
jgi:hypothetical protein